MVQSIGGVLDRLQQLGGFLGSPGDVALTKAADRGFDAGERRTEVMANGREKGRAHPVRGLELGRIGGSFGQAPTLEGGGGRSGERPQDSLVLTEKCWATHQERERGIHLYPKFRLVGRGWRRTGDGFDRGPGTMVVLQAGHLTNPEHATNLLQELG